MAGDLSSVKALTFDVFGTVVDWRGTIIREGEQFAAGIDWGRFADRWRAGYAPAMERVRRGQLPWMNLDRLHRMILDQVLVEFGLQGWGEERIDHLNRVWHRLHPWPDVIPGLQRLRKRFILATLSNGQVALLTNMARHAGLPWDCVLSSELAQHYKPDREVYEMAGRLLDLTPAQVMMVAAHTDDLHAARAVGFRTAFVMRPLEHGPEGTTNLVPDACFDVAANDFMDLAHQLGV